jgi:hypothetical protein
MNCTAYAWASGRIEFTTPKRRRKVPAGALPIVTGPRRQVRDLVACMARHGQGESNGMLLVPGIPEADTAMDQITALKKFRDLLKPYLTRRAA